MLRTSQPPESDTARRPLPWRRGFQPRHFQVDAASPCTAKTAHNLLDTTYPPKLRNSQQRKQSYSGGWNLPGTVPANPPRNSAFVSTATKSGRTEGTDAFSHCEGSGTTLIRFPFIGLILALIIRFLCCRRQWGKSIIWNYLRFREQLQTPQRAPFGPDQEGSQRVRRRIPP